jgi:ubiquinone/menaquinone biosynthesis C-methylase UbiE
MNSKPSDVDTPVARRPLDAALRRLLRGRPFPFARVRQGGSEGYIAYLQRAAAHPGIRALRARAHAHLDLREGQKVLDIGCGPGTMTVDFARAVGERGRVTGIDRDKSMAAEADDQARRMGVSGWTTHRRADCTALPFPAETFDACYCERVLQHLRDPGPALTISEALRVLTPGGHMVFVDTDWTTLSVEADDPALARRTGERYAAQFANPRSGHRLRQQCQVAGAAEVTAESFPVVIDLDLVERTFIARLNIVLVSAVRPA